MGGAAGSVTGTAQGTEAYPRLCDYRVEHILLGGALQPESAAAATGLPRWRQQVQYAVGHTLNDFYSLRPEVRRETPVQFLLERRWPPKGDAFPSLLHYWDVKTAVADELMRIVSQNHLQDTPVKLYEQWHVAVPELRLELALIFQLAWGSAAPGRCLSIQKFMVNVSKEVICGFRHMANVFCHMAYGLPAERIEIYSLLDGARFVYDGDSFSLQESLDYVRLLAVFLEPEVNKPLAINSEGRRNERREENCFWPRLM